MNVCAIEIILRNVGKSITYILKDLHRYHKNTQHNRGTFWKIQCILLSWLVTDLDNVLSHIWCQNVFWTPADLYLNAK